MGRIGELAALVAELRDGEGPGETAIPGLYLSRYTATSAPRHTVDRAVLCVVAQGAKCVLVNDARYVYDPETYLVLSLDLPLLGQIVEATPERPCLGVAVELDFAEIGALIVEAELPPSDPRSERGVFKSPLDAELLDAVIRYVGLLRRPAEIAVLAPLVRREIFYRLLLGEQSGLLRRMRAGSGQVQRIAAGLEWLKRNATRPIRMEELAREVNMSPSTMHAWFKAVTHMSPLQFQKQLRLQEARRILMSEPADAATASQRVGYESPSQFSREYRRLFGVPPLRDVGRLRAG
ncbi:AraC family transcriptional regulator [Gemmatimonadetes bacterium T265]|nr:AraC family transcriptional regulator [Gemmatimonadetes bacterium T265]